LDLTPSGRHKNKRGIKKASSIKTGKDVKERRNYSKEFNAEAVAPAGKKEKPVSRIALDSGINGNMLHRWIKRAREAATGGLPPFPGHGRPGDTELTRLWKEVRTLREANEILKKAAVIFAQTEHR
jgi:transposase